MLLQLHGLINNVRQQMKRVELSMCTHSSLAWMCSGLKGWDKRLIISDRAHIGESSGRPLEGVCVRARGAKDAKKSARGPVLLSLRCLLSLLRSV